MELVRDRTLADVSVEEIARRAGVARRTFFRYFPTKEDVVLDPRRIDRAWAAGALRSRRPDEDDIGFVLRIATGIQQRAFSMFRPEHQVRLHRLSHDEPALTGRSWLMLQEVRDLIVAGLSGRDADRAELFRVRTLVAACLIAMDAAITTWVEGGMTEDLESVVAVGANHLRSGFARSYAPSRLDPGEVS